MKKNWPVYLFLIFLLLVIFSLVINNKSEESKPIKFADVSFLNSYYEQPERKLIQEIGNLEDPVIKKNLEIIGKANAMEQKRKLLGANTICVFKANKYLPYTFEQFVNTFTGLILPQQLLAGGVKVSSDSNSSPLYISDMPMAPIVPLPTKPLPPGARAVDFARVKPVDADKAVFYGIAPKLFNKARDQGACGSCWAYSGVTCIEAQVVKKFLIENPAYVSIQYYIDCVQQCKGCKGGFPLFVYEQVAKDGYVVWDDYAPYLGKESGTCAPPKQRFPYQLQGAVVFATNGDAAYFTPNQFNDAFQYQNLELTMLGEAEIENLKKMLFNYGPISALLYVDDKMPFYSSGIYMTVDTKDGVKQKPNHAVVIGGYGINVYGERYWIIRNSWGAEYGESGNVPLSMDSPMCGFSIPIFDDVPPVK